MSGEVRRLTLTFLLSLLFHALLLSLTFGDEESGLPGFGFPWRERRIEAPNLRVDLVPARIAAAEPAGTSVMEPVRQTSIEQIVAARPTRTTSVSSAPIPGRTADAIAPKATAAAEAAPADVATAASPAKAPLRTQGSGEAAPAPTPDAVVSAIERPDETRSDVPAAPPAPTPVLAVESSASSPETVMPAPQPAGEVAQKRTEPEVPERAAELPMLDLPGRERQRQQDQLEAARVEAAQLEVESQEAARLAAAQQEAQRQEAERRQAARIEAARLEAERQEVARQAAAQLEAQRHEAERRQAARIEAARLEAERQEVARQAAAQLEAQRHEAERRQAARIEAARLEAEREEAARQAAARKEAARVLEEKEEDARREARRRAIGRQLDEEAARRDAASTAARAPSTLPLSLSTARRVRLWGRAHPNVELVQYAEVWALKIQSNTAVDTVREVAKRPHTSPMVTVAIRSDGSVESVTFEVSSGVAEIDDAIRRIVEGQRPYRAFPPALAREFDVIEIRRTWHFDTAVRLY